MKYIISEARLHDFIYRYLETFLESKIILRVDPYIGIEGPEIDDYSGSPQYMEYDHTDGRFWINKSFLESFMKLFAIDKKTAQNFISGWFSDKFDVEIKFVE